MFRRMPALAVAVALVAIVGCSNTPAAPALTDPNEILTKSVTAMQDVKTAHVEVAVRGSINADITGTGSSSTIKLDATSADADIDIPNKKFRASFVVPAFLGLNGEIIVIDDTTYTKTSLSGDKYQKSENSSTDVPVDTDPIAALAELQKFLDRPEISATKAADAKCGDKDCYVVEIDLTADEIKALASDSPDELDSFDEGSVKMAISVQKDTLRIGRLTITISAGEMGSVEISADFSRYDEPVSIEAPSADQVE